MREYRSFLLSITSFIFKIDKIRKSLQKTRYILNSVYLILGLINSSFLSLLMMDIIGIGIQIVFLTKRTHIGECVNSYGA